MDAVAQYAAALREALTMMRTAQLQLNAGAPQTNICTEIQTKPGSSANALWGHTDTAHTHTHGSKGQSTNTRTQPMTMYGPPKHPGHTQSQG